MGSSFKDFVRARQAQKAGAAAPPPERGLVAAGPGSRVPQFVGGGGGAPPQATSGPAKARRAATSPTTSITTFAAALRAVAEALESGEAAPAHGPLATCVGERGLERRLGNVVGAREAFVDAAARAWRPPERGACDGETCGVRGVALATSGGREDVRAVDRDDPEGWEEPHRAPSRPAPIHACDNRLCRFALHLGGGWRRLSEAARRDGRVDESFKLGWAALTCGVAAFEGSRFHYGVAELLESCKIDNFQQYAALLFFRYLRARPADPRAALCFALAARERAAASPGDAGLAGAAAGHVALAFRRFAGRGGRELERCALVAAAAALGPGGAAAFLADRAAARRTLATQALGCCAQVLARKGAPPNVNQIANKVELAKFELRAVPPTLVVGAEPLDPKCLTRPTWVVPAAAELRSAVRAWLDANGLAGHRSWFMKAASVEYGAGVEPLDVPADALADAARARILAAVDGGDARDCKWVLQPAVAPALVEGKKVSVRVYLLLTRARGRDAPFLYGEGLVSRARDAHGSGTKAAAVVHGGEGEHMDALSDVSDAYWPAIRAATRELLGAGSAKLWERAAAGCDYWTLLGLDFLPASDGKLWLLEANTGPRLWFDEARAAGPRDDAPPPSASLARVDARVTRPLLLDLAELLAHLRVDGGPPPSPANAWRALDV